MRFLITAPFRFMWRRRRTMVVGSLILFTFGLFTLVGTRVYSAGRAQNLIYTQDTVPPRPVAIIFGAWVDDAGDPSDMLADRVRTGVNLYKAGKVKALLLTGDNHIKSYDEPESMRQYALALGVPDSALVLDYAGFRTYDSCYRAREIFKVDQAILVTQAFHLDRALLTCNGLNVDSVGVAADAVREEGYNKINLVISTVREFPSTLFTVLDLMGNRQPTFLGEPLPISLVISR